MCLRAGKVEIVDHPDLMLAVIPDKKNRGYYEITHTKSGEKFKVPHSASGWNF